MRLDLTEVLQEPGRQTDYPVNEPPLVDEDIECLTPLEGMLTFNNTGGTLILTGNIETTTALACSRCAEYFEHPVSLTVKEAFELRHLSNARLAQVPTVIEEDENPDAGKLFDCAVFDLTELVRQAIMVEQPIQPLPPTDDEGRCAHCLRRPEEVLQEFGATSQIDAGDAPINPAFARLGELLKNNETQE